MRLLWAGRGRAEGSCGARRSGGAWLRALRRLLGQPLLFLGVAPGGLLSLFGLLLGALPGFFLGLLALLFPVLLSFLGDLGDPLLEVAEEPVELGALLLGRVVAAAAGCREGRVAGGEDRGLGRVPGAEHRGLGCVVAQVGGGAVIGAGGVHAHGGAGRVAGDVHGGLVVFRGGGTGHVPLGGVGVDAHGRAVRARVRSGDVVDGSGGRRIAGWRHAHGLRFVADRGGRSGWSAVLAGVEAHRARLIAHGRGRSGCATEVGGRLGVVRARVRRGRRLPGVDAHRARFVVRGAGSRWP
ncbi:hypothetical protein NORO109296_10970 [Nocardiopsis rhodophaea]